MEALSQAKAGADDLRGCALGRSHEPGGVRSGCGSDCKARRVLLIITYRPEFEPPWIGQPYVTSLNLNRLDVREIARS